MPVGPPPRQHASMVPSRTQVHDQEIPCRVIPDGDEVTAEALDGRARLSVLSTEDSCRCVPNLHLPQLSRAIEARRQVHGGQQKTRACLRHDSVREEVPLFEIRREDQPSHKSARGLDLCAARSGAETAGGDGRQFAQDIDHAWERLHQGCGHGAMVAARFLPRCSISSDQLFWVSQQQGLLVSRRRIGGPGFGGGKLRTPMACTARASVPLHLVPNP